MKVYLYVCEAHSKLGSFERSLTLAEADWFSSAMAKDMHLNLCQVRGCQSSRNQVIQVNFTRKNETLELQEPEKQEGRWP